VSRDAAADDEADGDPCLTQPPGQPCTCRPAWEGATQPAYTQRWKRLRLAKLRATPICEHPGCRMLAAQVDHIQPLAEGGDRYQWDNLRSLYTTHHQQKATADAQHGKTRSR
jgi:5-methylcytosine-specific restriction enzyme A